MMFQQDPCKLACRMLATADPAPGDGAGDLIKDYSGNAEDQNGGQCEKE